MSKRLLKIVLFMSVILPSVFAACIIDLLVSDRKRKFMYSSRIASFFSKSLLRVLGVKVLVRNDGNLRTRNSNFLVVSNHVSYIDIFVISSVIPSIFIASIDEVKDKFLLGTLARLGGSVFIERRCRGKLREEIETISEVLQSGFNVVLFPEGTSSNGDHVLSFKSPFLTPAIKTNVDVLPVCLKYVRVDGARLNPENRDSVLYYGDMTFFGHFFKLLRLSSIEVELIGLENIRVDSGLSRKAVAKLAFDSISLAYQ